ncbi:MAG TPA: TonB-dependent receptor [Kofleriaceae bacterium]|jgi:outer membrane receptor protein involved in Fe transport
MRFAIAGLVMLVSGTALAQNATTGAVRGRVIDAVTKEAIPGATVWVTSNETRVQSDAMTDSDGVYKISELLPGDYTVLVFVEDMTFKHPHVQVRANDSVTLYEKVKFGKTRGSIIEVNDKRPPMINGDGGDIKEVHTRAEFQREPIPGRDITAVAGSAAAAKNDGVGVAIAGSTGLDNRYFVDGVDITGLTFGDSGTPVLSEFVEQTEVITGGFNAEWGRAIGGIINTVIQTGTNEIHGAVFGTLSPGLLAAHAKTTPVNASSIDVTRNNVYDADFGAQISGPIIKDHLFFFLGFSPQVSRTDYNRTVRRQTDCRQLLDNGQLSTCDPRIESSGGYANGVPDIDPTTGFYITDKVDESTRTASSQQYSAVGKLSLAVTPEHQAQLSVIAVPGKSDSPGVYGLASSGGKSSGLTTDVLGRWTSKLNDGATTLEGLVAWHRSTSNSGALDSSLNGMPRQILEDGNLGTWSALGGESQDTTKGCTDNTTGGNDPYPFVTNCPMSTVSYAIGGPGSIRHDTEDRRMARASITQRGKLLGTHELKGGLDLEDDLKTTARFYSGGAYITNAVATGQVDIQRWVKLAGPNEDPSGFDHMCHTPAMGGATGMSGTRDVACDYIGGTIDSPGALVGGETVNWAAFLRDSWRPVPNVTVNLGMRYEEQRLRYANTVIGTEDELSGAPRGKNAMTLTGNWAPRLGLIWDPTEEGRSKIYTSWGRYFESIPMDINDRSFGGEVSYTQTFNSRASNQPCGAANMSLGGADGMNCLDSTAAAQREVLNGGKGVLVAPGIGAQYMDEILLGGEYMLGEDLKVGAVYQHRTLGRVIEDVSTDGAQSYIIANPGEWSESQQRALETRIAKETDMDTKSRLQQQLALFKGIRTFDKPTRDYDAIQLTIERRFIDHLSLRASYTYSRVFGNYPGSVSYDNGQIDPNISSQYDLIELLSNRAGKLPQDRPHSLKLDASYDFRIGKKSAFVVGTRGRLISGAPRNALGAHYLYGPDESFLLPRGILGRSAAEHGIDIHLGFSHSFSKDPKVPGTTAEIYVDIFNLYNNQGTFSTDDTYAPSVRLDSNGSGAAANNVNPISGGTYEDLIWAKALDVNGNETNNPTARNPNFGRTASRYAPASARFGFRVTF